MIKITTQDTPTYPSTTLNDIPVGTVFSGTIIGRTGYQFTGVFYKALGPVAVHANRDTVQRSGSFECLVVRLDGPGSNYFPWCRVVNNYRPAKEVELKLTY